MLRTARISILSLAIAIPFVVSAESAVAPSVTKTVSNENATLEYFCAEVEDVKFVGSGNKIEAHGDCNVVTVEGSGNVITLDAVTRIVVKGDRNSVKWAITDRAKPATSVTGAGNVLAANDQ